MDTEDLNNKRETLKTGYSWTRFILILPLFASFLGVITESEERAWNFVSFFIMIGLYFLLYQLRKLKYDNQNLYLIRGKREKVIPFSTVISIKKSGSKVNGERFWKLKYLNEEGKEKTIRYFKSFFYKDFNQKVRTANPKVVIWTHPHFNH